MLVYKIPMIILTKPNLLWRTQLQFQHGSKYCNIQLSSGLCLPDPNQSHSNLAMKQPYHSQPFLLSGVEYHVFPLTVQKPIMVTTYPNFVCDQSSKRKITLLLFNCGLIEHRPFCICFVL